jgi:hypothetical protein
LCLRLLNFGFRASFTLFAVVAINPFKAATSFQLSAPSSFLLKPAGKSAGKSQSVLPPPFASPRSS